jgi:hypothetical protein
MSVFERVRHWIVGTVAPRHGARAILRSAIEVIGAYGETLERKGSQPLSMKRAESELPFPKERIRSAVSVLHHTASSPAGRALLAEIVPPEQVDRLLSREMLEHLDASLVFLDDFVSDAGARAEREKWDAVLKVVAEIDPNFTEGLHSEHTPPGEASRNKS